MKKDKRYEEAEKLALKEAIKRTKEELKGYKEELKNYETMSTL